MPADGHAPYLLLPHDWQGSDAMGLRARGFALAVHEGTHAYNEVVIHGLRERSESQAWEWFDEATAIFVEAALFEKEFGTQPQLWLEHLGDWSRHSICPLTGERSRWRFCGRGSQAAMFLRYLERRSEFGPGWLMGLWRRVSKALLQGVRVPSALDVLVNEIENVLGLGRFAELFVDYSMQSYSIGAVEPRVAAKYGPFRRARFVQSLSPNQAHTLRITPPRPLACAYYVLKPTPGVRALRFSCSPWLVAGNLQALLGWAEPGQPLRPSGHFQKQEGQFVAMESVPEGMTGGCVVTFVNPDTSSRYTEIDALSLTVVAE